LFHRKESKWGESTTLYHEEHFCVGYPGVKEALPKLMEQAQSGFGLLQDEEKFIRIMLHVNADCRVGEILYIFLDRTA